MNRLFLRLCAAMAFMALANAECADELEIEVESARKLSFSGYNPTVQRFTNSPGEGNKIVLRGFAVLPEVEIVDQFITITAGEPCAETIEDDDIELGEGSTESSAMRRVLGFSVPFIMGRSAGLGSALLTTLALTSSVQLTSAQLACDLVPIEVDIFVEETEMMESSADELVAMATQTGQFNTCPPESFYWEHDDAVFGGYKGCVGEKALYPCPNDASSIGEIYNQTPTIWNGEQCVDTGYTMMNRTFVIAGGNPYDTQELIKRTGLNPVLHIPYMKGPYPRYDRGSDPRSGYDESNSARVTAFRMLDYIGAWSFDELIEDWDITITEGAEQGMVHLWGAKALEIAQTTCNRDIYAICEAPCYGYSTGDAAEIANRYADTFYNGTECLCSEDDSCREPTVTLSHVGWLPLTELPSVLGGDNNTYPADSTSPNSPWFENIVFPENPSGVIKNRPILSNPNRILCDGVYLWPMYFGARDYVIPKDEMPDCAGWAFSISKIWSAAARAGWIIYKKEPEVWNDAIIRSIGNSQSFTHGLLSDWTWHGQQQIMDIIMSKPLEDPSSWIGAYSEIIQEKWDYILDGFADCPVIQPTNDYSGAYVWFKYMPGFLGLSGTGVPSFFRDVLATETTSRSWQFRGADPAEYYGEGYSIYDFTRLNLYRDVGVYEEVARRGKIVCNDFDAVIGENTLSVNQWNAVWAAPEMRRRLSEVNDREIHKEIFLEAVPELTEGQLEYLIDGHLHSESKAAAIESCAPEYTTSCLYETVGFHDDDSMFV